MRALVLLAGLLVLTHGMSVDNNDIVEKDLRSINAGGEQPTLDQLLEDIAAREDHPTLSDQEDEDAAAGGDQPALRDQEDEGEVENMNPLDENADITLTQKGLSDKQKRVLNKFKVCIYYSPYLNYKQYRSAALYASFGSRRLRVYIYQAQIRMFGRRYFIYSLYYARRYYACGCPPWAALRLSSTYRG